MNGQIGNEILRVENGIVRLCNDSVTDTYSIGLRTTRGVEWKFISKELHDLLVKELSSQEGK
jgi:glucose/arabinose dehydrogenase